MSEYEMTHEPVDFSGQIESLRALITEVVQSGNGQPSRRAEAIFFFGDELWSKLEDAVSPRFANAPGKITGTFTARIPVEGKIVVVCGEVWSYKRKPCYEWGAPGWHGCRKLPGHDGIHICPCGSRHE